MSIILAFVLGVSFLLFVYGTFAEHRKKGRAAQDMWPFRPRAAADFQQSHGDRSPF